MFNDNDNQSKNQDQPMTHFNLKRVSAPVIENNSCYKLLISDALKGDLAGIRKTCSCFYRLLNDDLGRSQAAIALYGALESGHHPVVDFLCSHFRLNYERQLIQQLDGSTKTDFIIFYVETPTTTEGNSGDEEKSEESKVLTPTESEEDQTEEKTQSELDLEFAISETVQKSEENKSEEAKSQTVPARLIGDALILQAERGNLEAIKSLCHGNSFDKNRAKAQAAKALDQAIEKAHFEVADFLCQFFGLTRRYRLVYGNNIETRIAPFIPGFDGESEGESEEISTPTQNLTPTQSQKKSVPISMDSIEKILRTAISGVNVDLVKIICQECQLTKSDLQQFEGILLLASKSPHPKMLNYFLSTYTI